MKYEWVLRRYISTDENGKKALELANEGVGYHVINRERSKGEDIILAFKWIPIDKHGNSRPLPQHLELASKYQIEKLIEWDAKRGNTSANEDRRTDKDIIKPSFMDGIKL